MPPQALEEKVQMLLTRRRCSLAMVSAAEAVSRRPGAFAFDIVTQSL